MKEGHPRIKKNYILSKNQTTDYSEYVDKFTNHGELDKFLIPKQTKSERITLSNRARSISTPVRGNRFMKKSRLNQSGTL